MTVRRSARLQGQDAPTPIVQEKPRLVGATSNVTSSKKRKAQTSSVNKDIGVNKRNTATPPSDEVSSLPTETPVDPQDDALSSLPVEILDLILDAIQQDPKGSSTMSKLGRTSKRWQLIMGNRLHRLLTVHAAYHAHITNLIRAIEPHLTIAQRKQLKKEGKYKGQQAKYSSKLDPDTVPICAGYVRQILVSRVMPGKKHQYICDRYIEEVFKNLKNLEVIDTEILTLSMAQSMTSMNNLTAFRLYADEIEEDIAEAISNIKNLTHLAILNTTIVERGNTVRSILLNSTSTLQSLEVKSSSYFYNFVKDWEVMIANRRAFTRGESSLTALTSLSLCYLSFDEDFVKSLSKAIDLTRLHELTIQSLGRRQDLFLKQLITSFRAARDAGTKVKLRTLRMDMSSSQWDIKHVEEEAAFVLQCCFLHTFNTLTTLEIEKFMQSTAVPHNTRPGIPQSLLDGILRHKSLTDLSISPKPHESNDRTPWLSTSAVEAIRDALPKLRRFEHTPGQNMILWRPRKPWLTD